MKRISILLSLCALIATFSLKAQNKVISFDGVNDYIDLGNSVGNNIRTIELWFKPSQTIDASISDFISLVQRNTGFSTADSNEFGLAFNYLGSNKGTLFFHVKNTAGATFSIYSDSNQWNANQWYHVAAVIDPVQGMKLFINGIQQSQTNSYSGNTGVSTVITAAGRWGNFNSRYFEGSIDNLKFDSNPIYSNNFNPECPNFPSYFPNRAFWNFNGASSTTASDGTSNSFSANIFGATRLLDEVCENNNILSFDGIDDYIDLGNSSGNNIRTIELWFKPGQTIDASISDYISLVQRNTGFSTADSNEFGLAFNYLGSNKGTLIFHVRNTAGTTFSIYSDSNQWNANQWYHVAAVIDPVQGMKLFIDGIQQSQTNSYSGNTGVSTVITAAGRWGNFNSRYFEGSMDDLKFHTTAVYASNFTPSCPDQTSLIADHGNWNFNGVSSLYAIDSSANNFISSIFGANRDSDTICNTLVGIPDFLNTNNGLLVYPNPSHHLLNFKVNDTNKSIQTIEIIDLNGQLVFSKAFNSSNLTINVEYLSNGIYFYQLLGTNVFYSGKFIKQ